MRMMDIDYAWTDMEYSQEQNFKNELPIDDDYDYDYDDAYEVSMNYKPTTYKPLSYVQKIDTEKEQERKKTELMAWRKMFPKPIRTLQSFETMYEDMKKEKLVYYEKLRLERLSQQKVSQPTINYEIRLPYKRKNNYNKQTNINSLVVDKTYKQIQTQRRHMRKERRKDEKAKEIINIVPKPILVPQLLLEDDEPEPSESDNEFQEVAKEMAKEVVKNVEKEVVKNVVKEVVKNVEKEVVKNVVKEVVKNVEKEVVKNVEEAQEEEEEEEEEDFVQEYLKAQGKVTQKVVVPTVRPVQIVKVIEEPKMACNFSRMCRSVFDRTRCQHGTKCRYAHKAEQLVVRPCRFGYECYNVREIRATHYANKQNRTCDFWHPQECLSSYCKRMNLPSH